MMGSKERAFAPLPPVSLEDAVPPDHVYRHLERTLDRAFVRESVGGAHAGIGRPSIDPVVFFKLQLILFFAGLRSEHQVLRVADDRATNGSPWIPTRRASASVIRVIGVFAARSPTQEVYGVLRPIVPVG